MKRNIKLLLTLVLSTAMLLGVFAISAFANNECEHLGKSVRYVEADGSVNYDAVDIRVGYQFDKSLMSADLSWGWNYKLGSKVEGTLEGRYINENGLTNIVFADVIHDNFDKTVQVQIWYQINPDSEIVYGDWYSFTVLETLLALADNEENLASQEYVREALYRYDEETYAEYGPEEEDPCKDGHVYENCECKFCGTWLPALSYGDSFDFTTAEGFEAVVADDKLVLNGEFRNNGDSHQLGAESSVQFVAPANSQVTITGHSAAYGIFDIYLNGEKAEIAAENGVYRFTVTADTKVTIAPDEEKTHSYAYIKSVDIAEHIDRTISADTTISFGSEGNYKDSIVDFSGIQIGDNGGNNSQVKNGSFDLLLKAGSKVVIHGYPGYTSYQLNDGEAIESEYYTYIALDDTVLTVTPVSGNNYFYSIEITLHEGIAQVEGKAADCENAGYEAYYSCTCHGELTEKVVIKALGHKEQTIDGKAATCTEAGLTAGKKCSVCGKTITDQVEIPAKGHTSVKDEAVAPGCGNVGLTEGEHCGVCNTVIIPQTEIAKLSHAWSMTDVKIENAVGTFIYTCGVCGEAKEGYGPVVSDKHICDHTTNGIVAQDANYTNFNKWIDCSCGASSYAVTAHSAYTGSGTVHNFAKNNAADAYIPDGNGGWIKVGTKSVVDVATSYNLGTSGKDKNLEYLEFTYTITAPKAMTVNVFVSGRSTNTSGSNNTAVRLSKFIELYQDGNKVEVMYESLFPSYVEGKPYWTEQQLATIELNEGENTITFRYVKNMINGEVEYIGGKVYGAYLSYFRFAEDSKADDSCENNVHQLEKINEKAPKCIDGMKEHYICKICGQLFDAEYRLPTEAEYLAIPKIYSTHVYENVARLQADGSYAYECIRGCGSTKSHVCNGEGSYLVIAREPNQVWYEDGDLFNPDRMEIYLSNACAEGCTGTTVLAGHLSGYDALTFTYQNGDSFKTGDEYITINYNNGEQTLSVNLPVRVVDKGHTVTVDDNSDGFEITYNAPYETGDHKNVPGHRTNDQGKVGQSAYGGTYTNNFTNGDIATFTFTLEEASENANIVLRACTDRAVGGSSTPDHAVAVIAREMIIIKVDGVVVEIPDDAIFNGSITCLDKTDNRWAWTVWSDLDLGIFNLDAGEHTVEITFNNIGGYKSAENYNAGVQIDCLNVFLG